MTTETTIAATDNPGLANKLASEAVALAEQEKAATPVRAEIKTPANPIVELAVGLDVPFEERITTAEIRELNGADEEAIARLNDPAKALMLILERAVVKLGNKPTEKDLLDALLAGDRELLLLAIRKLTFGNEVNLEGNICQACVEPQKIQIDLDTDVEVKKLNIEDVEFTVPCKAGEVRVKLPTGFTQKALVASTNKTAAELDSVVLKNCILSINDKPLLNQSEVLRLSIKDRRDILKEISNRNPGPQLSEIKKPCPNCGQEVSLPLTLADLFQE